MDSDCQFGNIIPSDDEEEVEMIFINFFFFLLSLRDGRVSSNVLNMFAFNPTLIKPLTETYA